MKTLFPDERIVIEGDNKKVILTNKRIWKEDTSGGKSFYQSIMLQHISSIQCTIEDYIALLIIAGILFVMALYNGITDADVRVFGTLSAIGVLFVLSYFITRGSVIVVGSSSVKIKLPIKSMKKEKVLNFIDHIENAINENKAS